MNIATNLPEQPTNSTESKFKETLKENLRFLKSVLYLTKKVESPKLATIVAIVYIYFGTINTIAFNDFGFNWPYSVHMFQAYIGYGYFFEALISKYKLWRR